MREHGAGVTAAVEELIRAQRALGLDPLLLDGDQLPNPRAVGSWRGAGFPVRAWEAIGAADVVHVHALWLLSTWIGSFVARLRAKPYVVAPHGMLDPWALGQSRWKKRVSRLLFEDRLLAGAGCIHALCASERDAVRRLGIRAPVAVVPPGVDPTLVERRSGDVAGGPPYVLFLGRLHQKKGIDVLLRAFGTVAPRRPEWRLVIAGPDEVGIRAELARLAGTLGIERRVDFVGPMQGERKLQLLERAALFALASHSEGLPVAVLEAMALGLPVAISPACNLPEVERVGAGFVGPAAPEAFAGILDRAMGLDSAGRRTIGERGRALVAQRFTTRATAESLHRVYEWLCGRGREPESLAERGEAR